jgi:hypothetical protein
MTTANSGAQEKLVARLLEGSDDIFTDFVVAGLEDSLETICAEVERLLKIENLSPIQQTDLNELYHDGKATIRVLQYYTTNYYHDQGRLMNKAWDKLLGDVF